MQYPYKFIPNLENEVEHIPDESIISRTFFQDGGYKAILFGFATGQELSEHTASVPAIIHILEGEAELTLGTEKFMSQAGSWAYMPARLPHSLKAMIPVKMLLIMLKGD